MTSKSTRDMALSNWGEWNTSPDGGYSYDSINSASLVFIAQSMERLNVTMEAFRRDMLTLGSDGLHEVIRAHVKRIRKAEQRAAQRERKARRIRQAARKAVAS
jgi:DeoR/GlpR family transcriptional regulator of sugar metabolism